MSKKPKIFPVEKSDLHPRNKHRFPYDFKSLKEACPELSTFIQINKYQNESIDFSDPEAVKTLNRALLKYFYGINYWDIPANYLCPPIPGRADYIHYMADLLSEANNGILPAGNLIKVLDIGIGANCVYPIIGKREYGWHFVGSDIDPSAIRSAKLIIHKNEGLSGSIDCRLQKSSSDIFNGIIKPEEKFDLSICNPPFHTSKEEAEAGTERKWKNLGIKKDNKSASNFGGQNTELWYEGGEEAFVKKMIEQSAEKAGQCYWYSTLVSKKSNLPTVYWLLEKAKAVEVKTIEMAQGQKKSRIVAWTFLNAAQQKDWKMKHWNN